jgi:DNA repair protein RecO (recombination protein O)
MTIHSAAETSPAIVLRTRALGESDLLVVLLTPGHGKVEAAARGARNSKRRFPGGLPSGLRGLATMTRGRGALARLERFEATVDHSPVGRDLDRFAYVAYLCELTDELVLGRHPDPLVFAALCTALEAVIGGTPRPGQLRRYELALLTGLGLLPALVDCCVCGEPVLREPDETVAFDAGRGGVLCLAHGRGAPRLPGAVVAAAQRLALGEDPAPLEDAPAAERRALRDLTQAALKAHLRRPLQSLGFFAALARPASTSPDTGEGDAQ